jgi:hypothetical protein
MRIKTIVLILLITTKEKEMSDDIKVGNVNKAFKRPVPKAAPVETTDDAGSNDGMAELNAKMDKLLEFAQAIDWKMWVYLKANNYIE